MQADPAIEQLLERARAGEPQARERLLADCRSYLAILARAEVESWLRTKVDPSDLVQQTLMEAHLAFDRFRGGTRAEWLAWLRRILAHNAADFVRQYGGTAKRELRREVRFRSPAESSAGPAGVAEPAGPVETPSQILIRREREIELARALDQLAPDHREVIMLRNLQRLRFDEVAQRMGRSRPAAQMLWMRAIEKLKDALQEPSRPPGSAEPLD